MLTGNFDACTFNQFDDSRWSTRKQTVITNYQITNIHWMKSIHIFFNSNCINNCFFVNMLRKRKLYKNTVNILLLVQLVHQRKKIALGSGLRQTMHLGIVTQIMTRLLFVANIHL
ncbi:hypothetical protein D3C76_1364490 [compost metagenome]